MSPTPEQHIAITDLVARYCMALSVGDVEGWVSLFTPDGSFKVYGRTWDGHDKLRGMMKAAIPGLHLGGQPIIEMVDGDHARTRRNLLVIDPRDGIMRSAVYDDELLRTAGGWKFVSIRCQFIVAEGLSDRPAK